MDDNATEISYSFKLSLFGAPSEFRLMPDGLSWTIGRRSGLVPYDAVERIRVSFRPNGLFSRTYLTEIWAPSAPKITISSQSAKNIVEKENKAAPYRAFVEALHSRLGEAKTSPQLVSGIAAYLFWPGIVVFVGAALGLIALAIRAFDTGAWPALFFIALFFAMFVWQIGLYLAHNRPGRYAVDSLPRDLLPTV